MINEIKYTKRFNVGNYEHEEYSVAYSVSENESPEASMMKMKNFIQDSFTNTLGKSAAVNTPSPAPKKEKPASKTKSVKVADDAPADKEVDTEKEFKKETSEPKEPKKKRNQKKNVVYNRDLAEHKTEMASILNRDFPEWKATPESKAAAKALSGKLEGTPFLDGKTAAVLPEFVAAIADGMKVDEDL